MLAVFLAGLLALDQLGGTRGSPWELPEWRQKLAGFPTDPAPQLILTGDSTVSLGIRPELLGLPSYNLGRSGLVPGELDGITACLEGRLRGPAAILVSVTPELLFDFRNFQGTRPTRKVAVLASNIYAQPRLAGTLLLPNLGARRSALVGALKDLMASALGQPQATSYVIDPFGRRIETDQGPPTPLSTPALPPDEPSDPRILARTRECLEGFRDAWEGRGCHVYWILMPARPLYEEALATTHRHLMQSYLEVIQGVFRDRVLDLRGTVPEKGFQDRVHLNSDGATQTTGRLRSLLAARGLLPGGLAVHEFAN